MSNWIRQALPEIREELRLGDIVGRSANSVRLLKPSGGSVYLITGGPIHYLNEAGEWAPMDTGLVPDGNGWLGAIGLPARLHPDGRMRLGSRQHRTQIPGLKISDGKVSGNKLIRDFDGGQEVWTLHEAAVKHEFILHRRPSGFFRLVNQRVGVLPPQSREHPILAWDATETLFHAYADDLALNTWLQSLSDASYPVTIDPGVDYASFADGIVYGQDATYATARTSSAAGASGAASPARRVGQVLSDGLYTVYRLILKFDTSAIDDGITINQVNLKLTMTVDSSATDFTVGVKEYNWSASDPISVGNRETVFDDVLTASIIAIWQDTAGLSTNTPYTSGDLTTSYVNKTGNTYYALNSNRDQEASTPSGDEYITLAMIANATPSYRPYLVVDAGTVYTKSISGSVTPAGAPIKNTLKAAFTGSLTPAGALIKNTLKLLGGVITPTGSLLRDVMRTIRIRFASAPQSDILAGSAPEGKTRTAAAPESNTSVLQE